jgi:Transposase IS66 family
VRPHGPRGAAGGRPSRLLRPKAGGSDRFLDRVVELTDELFGCPIAVGTIDTILTRTAAKLEPVYEELLKQTRSAGALNIDETG